MQATTSFYPAGLPSPICFWLLMPTKLREAVPINLRGVQNLQHCKLLSPKMYLSLPKVRPTVFLLTETRAYLTLSSAKSSLKCCLLASLISRQRRPMVAPTSHTDMLGFADFTFCQIYGTSTSVHCTHHDNLTRK